MGSTYEQGKLHSLQKCNKNKATTWHTRSCFFIRMSTNSDSYNSSIVETNVKLQLSDINLRTDKHTHNFSARPFTLTNKNQKKIDEAP